MNYYQERKNEIVDLVNQIKKDRKKDTLSDELKVIQKVVGSYILLKHSYKSYIEYCAVYNYIQQSLIDKIQTCENNERGIVKDQIMRNAIVLVQLYKYIENGERYSFTDFMLGDVVNVKEVNSHIFGYTHFGLDDFLSNEKRKSTLINDLCNVLNVKSSENLISRYFSDLDIIQSTSTDKLNVLKKSIDGIVLDVSLREVELRLSGFPLHKQQTIILSPLIYLSETGHTIPLDWSSNEWLIFGKRSTGKLRITHLNKIELKCARNLEQSSIFERKIHDNIKTMIEDNWKRCTEEVRQSTAMKSTSLAIKHKTSVITGKKKLKKTSLGNPKKNEVESDSDIKIFDTTKGTKVGDEWDTLSLDSDAPHKSDPIEVVKQVLNSPLSVEERNLVGSYMAVNSKEGMSDTEKSVLDAETIDVDITDFVKRESMRTLRPEQYLNDEIISFYLKVCLEKRAEKQWDKQKNDKRSHFFSSYFWQALFDECNHNQDMRGKYNFNNVSRWSRKVSGGNIFEKKRIFIPINVGQMHWTLGVIHIQKKLIQYYNSMRGDRNKTSAATKCNGMLNYLKDEYKNKYGHEMNTSNWTIDSYPESVPQQLNGEYYP